jgi:regulator of replication initiation timing
MTTTQSRKVSDLINQLSAIEKSSASALFENDKLRSDAAHIVRKLSVELEKPEDAIALNSGQASRIHVSGCHV